MLTSKAKYGLKALVYLARRPEEAVVVSEIAEKESIPKKFLDVILLELKNNGLLLSKKGRGGGYQLARPAERIKIGYIIRILDGPLAPVACVSRTAYRPCLDCMDESTCVVRSIMQEVRDAISSILDNTSLSDLVARGGKLEPSVMYHI